MIHLPLTRQNAERLLHSLTRLEQLSPDHVDDARLLIHLLQQAQINFTQEHHCPICATSFPQHHVGRTGCYCSNACKQKAYRQRCNQRKRQFGPPGR